MKAAKTLSAIVLSETDLDVDASAIYGLINSKWARIAPLAHAIHMDADRTKGDLRPDRQPDGYTIVGYRYRYRDMPAGSPLPNPWNLSDTHPSTLNNIEVEPVYSKAS
jgi:hypothetical protein